MNAERVAMVFGHPGHEVAVAGAVARFRPRVLYVTRADSGHHRGREELSMEVLDFLGLADRATFLGISEKRSYERLHAGDADYYRRLRDRIRDWLAAVDPTAVFGDAFELYNIHHDLICALLCGALRELRAGEGRSVPFFELPLAPYATPDLAARPYRVFDRCWAACSYLELDRGEAESKRSLLDHVGGMNDYVRSLHGALHGERYRREPYRAVTESRDHAIRPAIGPWETDDECGRRKTREGLYERPLLFDDHFQPVVRALGLGGVDP